MKRPVPRLRTPHPKRFAAPVTEHAHPLARRFFEILSEESTSMADVAERAGLSHVTISKWRNAHAPTIVTLEAALNVLGYELQIVERKNA